MRAIAGLAAVLLTSGGLLWVIYQFGEMNNSIQVLNRKVSGLTEDNVRLQHWMALQPRALQTINPLINSEISQLPIPGGVQSMPIPNGKPAVASEESINAERAIAQTRMESVQELARHMEVQTAALPNDGDNRPAGPLNEMIMKARVGR